MELHLPLPRSLKDKRSVLRPILDGARHRFGVAASEVGMQDLWQSAELGFAAVASTAGHVGEVLDKDGRTGGPTRTAAGLGTSTIDGWRPVGP